VGFHVEKSIECFLGVLLVCVCAAEVAKIRSMRALSMSKVCWDAFSR